MHANSTPPIPPKMITPSAAHRRQMIWQAWLPLAVSIIAVLALAILAIVGAAVGSPQVERWGNISAVIVILPWLIIGLVLMAIVGGLAFGVTWLLKKMPGWMLKLQMFMIRLALIFRRVADAVTRPVVGASTFSARARALWRKLAG